MKSVVVVLAVVLGAEAFVSPRRSWAPGGRAAGSELSAKSKKKKLVAPDGAVIGSEEPKVEASPGVEALAEAAASFEAAAEKAVEAAEAEKAKLDEVAAKVAEESAAQASADAAVAVEAEAAKKRADEEAAKAKAEFDAAAATNKVEVDAVAAKKADALAALEAATATNDMDALAAALLQASEAGLGSSTAEVEVAQAKFEALECLEEACSVEAWPPVNKMAALRSALEVAARASVTSGTVLDGVFLALADTERIAALTAAGEKTVATREEKFFQAAAWKAARKVEALQAKGQRTIDERTAKQTALAAYLKAQRRLALTGTWTDDRGWPLFQIDADATLHVFPSVGENAKLVFVDEDEFTTTVTVTLNMSRFSPRGDYRGTFPATIKGVFAGNSFEGEIVKDDSESASTRATPFSKNFTMQKETPGAFAELSRQE